VKRPGQGERAIRGKGTKQEARGRNSAGPPRQKSPVVRRFECWQKRWTAGRPPHAHAALAVGCFVIGWDARWREGGEGFFSWAGAATAARRPGGSRSTRSGLGSSSAPKRGNRSHGMCGWRCDAPGADCNEEVTGVSGQNAGSRRLRARPRCAPGVLERYCSEYS